MIDQLTVDIMLANAWFVLKETKELSSLQIKKTYRPLVRRALMYEEQPATLAGIDGLMIGRRVSIPESLRIHEDTALDYYTNSEILKLAKVVG